VGDRVGEDDTYDGRFEAREIYEPGLSPGTELVILSGCETASGGTGEDFGLLTRAFFAAGADQVVASLWSVDDACAGYFLCPECFSPGFRDKSEWKQALAVKTRDRIIASFCPEFSLHSATQLA
jgi:hypothetical protein